MYDLLLPSGTKGLREQNICETKLKFVNWTSKTERIVELKMAKEQSFISFTYLFMDFILLWHKINKIEHAFKTWLIKVNLTKMYLNLILHKNKHVHFSLTSFSLNCGIRVCEISIWVENTEFKIQKLKYIGFVSQSIVFKTEGL